MSGGPTDLDAPTPAGVDLTIEFMGPVLRPRGQDREVPLSLSPGSTTDDLLRELGYRPSHARHVGVFRDGQRLPRGAALQPGERLTIAVAMGGG